MLTKRHINKLIIAEKPIFSFIHFHYIPHNGQMFLHRHDYLYYYLNTIWYFLKQLCQYRLVTKKLTDWTKINTRLAYCFKRSLCRFLLHQVLDRSNPIWDKTLCNPQFNILSLCDIGCRFLMWELSFYNKELK